ncbi:MAG: phosphoglycerate kinase [Rickettsiales bacterium]
MSAHNAFPLRRPSDINVTPGMRVFCRVDFNVPVEHGRITDATRVERVIPTLRYLIERHAKVIVLSHFGRPEGEFVRSMSLAPLADMLAGLLNGAAPVRFAMDCVGREAEEAISAMKDGEVLLLENLRFHPGEESNDPAFADALAELGDAFVNDAFSCSHRAHASIVGLAERLPAAAGFLLEEEIACLRRYLDCPEKPLAAIVGGSKISTKLGLIHSLVEHADMVAIGGAMANTFLKAQGKEIGRSLYEKDLLGEAAAIVQKSEKLGCRLILPTDATLCASLHDGAHCEVRSVDAVTPNKMMLDLGPRSVARIIEMIDCAKTLVWNGPLGAFEFRPFETATVSVARAAALAVAEKRLVAVAGGGDVIAGLKKAGLADALTYISTAGGAFLEWLENPNLPGVAALAKG